MLLISPKIPRVLQNTYIYSYTWEFLQNEPCNQLLTMGKANHYGSSMNLPIEASKADYQDHYDMHLHISDRQISLTNMVVNHMAH